jgi:hypothetical protein
VAWYGVVWRGVARCGVAWRGVAWRGEVWCVAWCAVCGVWLVCFVSVVCVAWRGVV